MIMYLLLEMNLDDQSSLMIIREEVDRKRRINNEASCRTNNSKHK